MQIFHKATIIIDTVQIAQDLLEKCASKYSDRPQIEVIKHQYVAPWRIMTKRAVS